MSNIKRPENFPKVPEEVKRNPEKFNEWLWSIALAKDNQPIENKTYAAEKLAKIYSRYKKEIYSKKSQTAQEIAKEEAGILLKNVIQYSPVGFLTGCGVPDSISVEPLTPSPGDNVTLNFSKSHIEGNVPQGTVNLNLNSVDDGLDIQGNIPNGSMNLKCRAFNNNKIAVECNILDYRTSLDGTWKSNGYFNIGNSEGTVNLRGNISNDGHIILNGTVPEGTVNLEANSVSVVGAVPSGDNISWWLPVFIRDIYGHLWFTNIGPVLDY